MGIEEQIEGLNFGRSGGQESIRRKKELFDFRICEGKNIRFTPPKKI